MRFAKAGRHREPLDRGPFLSQARGAGGAAGGAADPRAARPAEPLELADWTGGQLADGRGRVVANFFGKILPVFGCIGTDLCKKIRVFQNFSKSTRLSS